MFSKRVSIQPIHSSSEKMNFILRRIHHALLGSFVFFSLLIGFSEAATAQQASPKPTLIISFQQDKIRINNPVLATILLTNEADLPITQANLSVVTPDFIHIHPEGCSKPAQTGPIDLGALPAHSVLATPKTLCLQVEPASAVSGSYNLLFSVMYSQEERTGVVTAEKALQVDLIGSEVILGVPLAFAGFVLPGLMILIALRWFGVPFARDLETEDRIIYGVILSLLLLGPFTLLARKAATAPWIQWLDIQQEISIERLGVYIVMGLALGVVMGVVYRWYDQSRKARAAAAIEALKFRDGDGRAKLIYKALKLNNRVYKKKFYFQHNKDQSRVYGYHYALVGDFIYVFPSFQLIASRLLEEDLRKKVLDAARPLDTFRSDPVRISSVLELLGDDHSDAFIIQYAVDEISADGLPGPDNTGQTYITLDASKYSPPPPLETTQVGYLLELLENEPY